MTGVQRPIIYTTRSPDLETEKFVSVYGIPLGLVLLALAMASKGFWEQAGKDAWDVTKKHSGKYVLSVLQFVCLGAIYWLANLGNSRLQSIDKPVTAAQVAMCFNVGIIISMLCVVVVALFVLEVGLTLLRLLRKQRELLTARMDSVSAVHASLSKLHQKTDL